jgi:hypothetical protein
MIHIIPNIYDPGPIITMIKCWMLKRNCCAANTPGFIFIVLGCI